MVEYLKKSREIVEAQPDQNTNNNRWTEYYTDLGGLFTLFPANVGKKDMRVVTQLINFLARKGVHSNEELLSVDVNELSEKRGFGGVMAQLLLRIQDVARTKIKEVLE